MTNFRAFRQEFLIHGTILNLAEVQLSNHQPQRSLKTRSVDLFMHFVENIFNFEAFILWLVDTRSRNHRCIDDSWRQEGGENMLL